MNLNQCRLNQSVFKGQDKDNIYLFKQDFIKIHVQILRLALSVKKVPDLSWNPGVPGVLRIVT